MNNTEAELAVADTTNTEIQEELDELHDDLKALADNYKDEKTATKTLKTRFVPFLVHWAT